VEERESEESEYKKCKQYERSIDHVIFSLEWKRKKWNFLHMYASTVEEYKTLPLKVASFGGGKKAWEGMKKHGKAFVFLFVQIHAYVQKIFTFYGFLGKKLHDWPSKLIRVHVHAK